MPSSARTPAILLLTAAALAALAPPLTDWAFPARPWLTGPLSALAAGWFWTLAGGTALLQAGLLARRSPWPARLAAATAAALLTAALLAAGAELAAPDWFAGRLAGLLGQNAWHGVPGLGPGLSWGLDLLHRGLEALGLREGHVWDRLPEGTLPGLALLAGLWLGWLVLLARRRAAPAGAARGLLLGGAAVLLAALLAHPLARDRGVALAGTGTFAALAAGAWAICLALAPAVLPGGGTPARKDAPGNGQGNAKGNGKSRPKAAKTGRR